VRKLSFLTYQILFNIYAVIFARQLGFLFLKFNLAISLDCSTPIVMANAICRRYLGAGHLI